MNEKKWTKKRSEKYDPLSGGGRGGYPDNKFYSFFIVYIA